MTEIQLNENNASECGMFTEIFRDSESTENAYKKLHEIGKTKDDINMVRSDVTLKKYFSGHFQETESDSKDAEGVGTGSTVGVTIGAIVGVLSAIVTSIAIPGLGIVLAGPIAVGFAGAGVLFHALLLERL